LKAVLAFLTAAVAAVGVAGCSTPLRIPPAPPNPLEALISIERYPVFWLGERFAGLPLSEVEEDIGGAVTLGYGACTRGGQYSCLLPLTVVTSPENSFLPHGTLPLERVSVRGITAYATSDRRIYELPTASVIVAIYAQTPSLAREAVIGLAALNGTVLPGEPLPPPQKSSYAQTPLSSQLVVVKGPTGHATTGPGATAHTSTSKQTKAR